MSLTSAYLFLCSGIIFLCFLLQALHNSILFFSLWFSFRFPLSYIVVDIRDVILLAFRLKV